DSNPSEGTVTIEIVKSKGEDSSRHGGSIAYLGAINPNINTGNWEINVDVAGEENTQRVYFTATATNSLGDTSEFSENVFVGGNNIQNNTTNPVSTTTPKPTPYTISLSLYRSTTNQT